PNGEADNFMCSHFDSFPVSSGWTQHLFGTLADGERAHRLGIGMRRSFHKIVLHIVPEFFTKHIAPIFPEGFAPGAHTRFMMTSSHPIHSGGASDLSRHLRNAFCA